MDAIEAFLQQLVLLLEVEPDLSRQSISAWLQVSMAACRARTGYDSRPSEALAALCAKVLDTPVEVLRAP